MIGLGSRLDLVLISVGFCLDFALSFAFTRILIHSSFSIGSQSPLGGPRKSSEVLGSLLNSTDFLGGPRKSSEVLGSPGTFWEVLGSPRKSSEVLGTYILRGY